MSAKPKRITVAAAKRYFKTGAALASWLGIRRQAVYQWRGRYVPKRHQKRLRRKMGVS